MLCRRDEREAVAPELAHTGCAITNDHTPALLEGDALELWESRFEHLCAGLRDASHLRREWRRLAASTLTHRLLSYYYEARRHGAGSAWRRAARQLGSPEFMHVLRGVVSLGAR